MTCIVGLKYGDRVLLAGDRMAASDWDAFTTSSPKVFSNGPMLLGYTSSFRMGQLLQHALVVPSQPKAMEDERYLVTRFIPAVRTCLKEGGYVKTENGRDSGGLFLVGYRGGLWQVDSDFQVTSASEGMMAVGCGAAYALGALHAAIRHPHYRWRDPAAMLMHALEAAATFCAGVRGPFDVLEQMAEPDGLRLSRPLGARRGGEGCHVASPA